jgi:hypothetical protein
VGDQRADAGKAGEHRRRECDGQLGDRSLHVVDPRVQPVEAIIHPVEAVVDPVETVVYQVETFVDTVESLVDPEVEVVEALIRPPTLTGSIVADQGEACCLRPCKWKKEKRLRQ